MMRRAFWFLLGAAVALFTASWFKKKAADLGEKLTPENLARSVVEHGVAVGRRVGEFIGEASRSVRATRERPADPGSPPAA
jgi:hypothetical protein